jgi:hypothetical protein
MASIHCPAIIGITTLLLLSGPPSLRAQNSYPPSGDAIIHGLTIGTGRTGQASNTALGDSAHFYNKGGFNNTAVGRSALFHNITGNDNTAVGYQALYNNVSGSYNLAGASGALFSNKSGSYNVALGQMALYSNSGNDNDAVGAYALYSNTTGLANTACGLYTLYYNTSGSYNSAFGLEALFTNVTGSYNTGLGTSADVASSDLSNATAIGYAAVATASNSVMAGNTSVTSIGGYVGWTTFSDGRYKKNIDRHVPGLAFINRLEPVTYTLDVEGIESRLHTHMNSNGPDGRPIPGLLINPILQQARQEKSRIVYTGFIAQDVEKAAQSLGYSFSGVDRPKDDQQSFYGLRYDDFVVPLVRAAQELAANDDSLKEADAAINTRLDRIEKRLGIDPDGRGAISITLSSARLFQNAPNPFNQHTLIQYYLPRNSGHASIQVTGMSGETIRTIAVGGYGYGEVDVQTGQLASGTYTYSLYVDGTRIDTKKMVLIK